MQASLMSRPTVRCSSIAAAGQQAQLAMPRPCMVQQARLLVAVNFAWSTSAAAQQGHAQVRVAGGCVARAWIVLWS